MAAKGKKTLDERLLMALACGATVEAAALSAGVSKRTAYRRLDDPAFVRRLQALRSDMLGRTSGMLTAAGGEGVKTLLSLMRETAPPSVRLGAAKAVLEIGMKVREQAELEQRLCALEQQMLQNG
jgi:hypothetical protein